MIGLIGGCDTDHPLNRRRVERGGGTVVAGRSDEDRTLRDRVRDGLVERRVVRRSAEAHADHASSCVGGLHDPGGDDRSIAGPVGAEDLDREDRAGPADSCDALVVVGARRDDPGNGCAVPVVVDRS